jgi:hypothetical protein
MRYGYCGLSYDDNDAKSGAALSKGQIITIGSAKAKNVGADIRGAA